MPSPDTVTALFGRATGMFSPRQVSKALGLSLQTLWRMRQRREFPDPIQLSPGRVGYPANMLGAWLEARAGGSPSRGERTPVKRERKREPPKPGVERQPKRRSA